MDCPHRPAATACLVLLITLVTTAESSAQRYNDFTRVRGRPSPWASVVELRAGLLGSLADEKDESIGLEDEIGWDGYALYHQDRFGDRQAELDLYAGRDGAYLGVLEGDLLGHETQSRLEVTARYFPFYREGFYRDGNFVPTGRYEGKDFGVSLGVARDLGDGLRLEAAVFFRRHLFDRNGDTPFNYVIPDDYNSYGGRVYLEHANLALDRLTGRPEQGFILTLGVEREQNTSDRTFGVVGIFESSLPSGLWRGFGHLEWYLPQSEAMTWVIKADGSLSDEEDRVYNYDAQKPIGHFWVDGQVGFRIDFGTAFWLTPAVRGQYVKALDQNGISSSTELFFGAGIDMGLALGDTLALIGEYSYLENESREPVSTSSDTFGEHRFFVGFEARFGGQRR